MSYQHIVTQERVLIEAYTLNEKSLSYRRPVRKMRIYNVKKV